jgi:hypothetical protein
LTLGAFILWRVLEDQEDVGCRVGAVIVARERVAVCKLQLCKMRRRKKNGGYAWLSLSVSRIAFATAKLIRLSRPNPELTMLR